MGNELYSFIYKALKDKELNSLSVEKFSEEVFQRYYLWMQKTGVYSPYYLFLDTKREIIDEIQKVYKIKRRSLFQLRAYKEIKKV